MSIPQIRTEAIEAVGRKILMEYDPSLLSGQPCPVPIETITEPKTADTAVTESDESDAAKILELLKNPETAALLKQLAKAL